MNAPSLLVGVVDSGLPDPAPPGIVAARAFSRGGDGKIRTGATVADPSGHGSQICRLLLDQACCLLVAQVFSRARTSPAQVAAAIDWLVDRGAALINLSLGQRRASVDLRLACERAAKAGVVLVASSPARGAPVFPAAYPMCIAVSGDARCDADEISWLAGETADFGAHPFASAGEPAAGGASFAAARITARIARLLAAGSAPGEVVGALRAQASYQGCERRRA